MSKLKEITEGWFNHIFPSEEIKKLAEKRANICASCPSNINNICDDCGCYLPAKTKSPSSNCPKKLW